MVTVLATSIVPLTGFFVPAAMVVFVIVWAVFLGFDQRQQDPDGSAVTQRITNRLMCLRSDTQQVLCRVTTVDYGVK